MKVRVIGGGDALYTNDINGLGGFGCKFSCNFCELPNTLFHLKPGTEEYKAEGAKKRTYSRALALSHARPEVWPLQCPVCGDITEEEWDAERTKEKTKSWYSSFSLKHYAQQWHCPPLLVGVDHIDHAMCVLHVLLGISGTIYKLAIAAHVENETQAMVINTYLHGILKIYIGRTKVMSKSEAATMLKRPSFVGSEAPKVLQHLEMLMHLINYNSTEQLEIRAEAAAAERERVGVRAGGGEDEDGPELTELQHKQLAATRTFMCFYNCVAKRLVDPQDKTQRKNKAQAVQVLAYDFHDAYKLAFGDAACTPYVHMSVCHLAKQIKNIEADIMELSGQALEHLNLKRKGDGRHTNHQVWTAEDVTRTGRRKRGVMDQLMQTEYNRKYAQDKCGQRMSDYQIKVENERRKKEDMAPMDAVNIGSGLLEALKGGDCKRAKYEHQTEWQKKEGGCASASVININT
jgi:hypothetical protein